MKKTINYAEAESDEDDEDIFKPTRPSKTRGRALKRRKVSRSDEEDDFAQESEGELEAVDEGENIALLTFCIELTEHV